MTKNRTVVRAIAFSSATLLAGAVTTVGAANIAYDASLGLGHSDNIRRVSANEEDENIAAAGLRFSLDQRSTRLQADAIGNFSYAEYLDDTYDSELLGNFAGNARFGIVPQRVEWVVTDNYGQVLGDPFAPLTPDNRENINFFSTGPDLTAAFGSRTRLRFGARYLLTTYEDRPLDADSVSGELSLLRQLSGASMVSMHARQQQVEYDLAALNADYDQFDVFGRYDISGARTDLSVDLGYTQIDRDVAADTEDSLLFRLDAARRLTAASTATLSAGREFANSGSAFSADQSGNIIGLDAVPGQQTPQPFTNDYATLGWSFARNRTGLTLSVGWSNRVYEGTDAVEQTLTTVGMQFRRDLSSRATLTLNGAYSSGDFEIQGDYKDISARVALRWRLSGALALDGSVGRFRRSSDVPAGDYNENQVWLSLVYTHGTPRTALPMHDFAVDQGQ